MANKKKKIKKKVRSKIDGMPIIREMPKKKKSIKI